MEDLYLNAILPPTEVECKHWKISIFNHTFIFTNHAKFNLGDSASIGKGLHSLDFVYEGNVQCPLRRT